MALFGNCVHIYSVSIVIVHIFHHEQASLSERMGIRTTALLTNMDNVIGRTVGNALEVAEALECLRGVGPNTLKELVIELGTYTHARKHARTHGSTHARKHARTHLSEVKGCWIVMS